MPAEMEAGENGAMGRIEDFGETEGVAITVLVDNSADLIIKSTETVIRFKEANTMVFLVRGIFMIFCGLTFPLQVLPAWMRKVASFLPLTYAIQGIRRVALADASFADVLPDLRSLTVFALLMPTAGYLTFRFAERRSRRTGALGQY